MDIYKAPLNQVSKVPESCKNREMLIVEAAQCLGKPAVLHCPVSTVQSPYVLGYSADNDLSAGTLYLETTSRGCGISQYTNLFMRFK